MTITITTKSAYHMLYQIRGRQLATTKDYEKYSNYIIENYNSDISGEGFTKNLQKKLQFFTETSEKINISNLKDVGQVGFPIKYNKTHLQLKMASEYVNNKGDELITEIEQKKLFGNPDEDTKSLPQYEEVINGGFWGSEKPSVKSVLLYSIASTLNHDVQKLPKLTGAATFYPFYSESHELSGDIVQNYPFASVKGLNLFGDYQFGGHRYFSEPYPNLGQRLFAGEDCSSSLAKAIGLPDKKVLSFTTKFCHDIYDKPQTDNSFQPIASSEKGSINIGLIQQGDFYLIGGHAALIVDKTLDGKIVCYEFNRDIDTLENKFLGGMTRARDLSVSEKVVKILRPTGLELHESLSEQSVLDAFNQKFQEQKIFDITTSGDWGMFIDAF